MLSCRRKANRKARRRLRLKHKAGLEDLEGHCNELVAANAGISSMPPSLSRMCQGVLQPNAMLAAIRRHQMTARLSSLNLRRQNVAIMRLRDMIAIEPVWCCCHSH